MKTAKDIARLVLTLFLITAVVAGALAGVNAVTEERIAKSNAEKKQRAIALVLPDAEKAEELPVGENESGIRAVYASSAGYAIEVETAGFGGAIDMMVGVSRDGKILGVSVISHTETPGLGANAAADNTAGRDFRKGFEGLSGSVAVTKDGGQVEALTSATITSRAVCAGINAALAYVAGLDG